MNPELQKTRVPGYLRKFHFSKIQIEPRPAEVNWITGFLDTIQIASAIHLMNGKFFHTKILRSVFLMKIPEGTRFVCRSYASFLFHSRPFRDGSRILK
jgi:hypothetical protein